MLLAFSVSIYAAGFTWYSQTDARWKQNGLGSGKTSIGKSGCVLSCISMLLNGEASNPRVTPDQLNNWLRKNGGYAGGNLMRWQVPAEIDGNGLGLELQSQIDKANDWRYLGQELDKGNKVVVKVAGRRSHWVLVVKRDGPENSPASYKVLDPGTKEYQQRTLAYWGGFKAARSYSGNWLDEDAFDLTSLIHVEPVDEGEEFLYALSGRPVPANVYVTLENKLDVDISGYFILGLFDPSDRLVGTVSWDYVNIPAADSADLLYEMPDVSPLNTDGYDLRIIYSKYFSALPSQHEAVVLPSPGMLNNTSIPQPH